MTEPRSASADQTTAAGRTVPADGGLDDPMVAAAARMAAWSDATVAASLLAVDPFALGGIVVRARVGPVRDAWMADLRRAMAGRPWRRLPAHTSEDRLFGGLDLAATLSHGRPVAHRGVLAEANGGVVVVPMAERMSATTAGALCTGLDRGEVILERDGLADRSSTRFGVVLLDESVDDEAVSVALADRLAIHIDLTAIRWSDVQADDDPTPNAPGEIERVDWRHVDVSPDVLSGLCEVAAVLGIASLRAPLGALRVAQASAAASGRTAVDESDIQLAARLVLAPRATRMPAPPEDAPPEPPPPDNQEPSAEEDAPDDPPDELKGPLADVVLEAVASAMPAGLLAQLAVARHAVARTSGSAGAVVATNQRGRPSGTRRGHPRSGGRLNVVETLRAAAPWQRVRAKSTRAESAAPKRRRTEVRQDDFRITRYKRRTETLTVFAVDASGSAALQRLAEAKGAVEQVLADCYVRRDHVALVAFRGTQAELLLPPTRSLVRAKRCLASMAGGGATPLATGLDSARILADSARKRGQSPVLVVMTDGRGNIALDGEADRSRAREDAHQAARTIRDGGIPALFVDTAPRPRPESRQLSDSMGAHYLHLPYAEDRAIAAWVAGRDPKE